MMRNELINNDTERRNRSSNPFGGVNLELLARIAALEATVSELTNKIETVATDENFGVVKLSNLSSVTQSDGLALAASEKNSSISGTLANNIEQVKENSKWIRIENEFSLHESVQRFSARYNPLTKEVHIFFSTYYNVPVANTTSIITTNAYRPDTSYRDTFLVQARWDQDYREGRNFYFHMICYDAGNFVAYYPLPGNAYVLTSEFSYIARRD